MIDNYLIIENICVSRHYYKIKIIRGMQFALYKYVIYLFCF